MEPFISDVETLFMFFRRKKVVRMYIENDPEKFCPRIWLPVLDYVIKFLSISKEEKDEHAAALKETIDLLAVSSFYPILYQSKKAKQHFVKVFCQHFVPQVQKYFKVPIKMPSGLLLNRNEILATFLDFLLQIWNYPANRDGENDEDGIWNMPALFHTVHNELKYLLTFLGDVPFQFCTTPECLQDHLNILLAEFEILANHVGHFTFFFVLAPYLNRFTESDEAVYALMQKVECLNANINQYCITFSELNPMNDTIMPMVTRAIDSHSIVNSVLEDVESLVKKRFHVTVNVDMEDQISELYEELKLVSQETENDGFIAIREIAYEVEYLINSYVVGNLPVWYLRLRLPAVILKLKLNRSRLQKMKSDTHVSLVTKDFSGEVSLEPTETTTPIIEDNLFGIDETKNEILDKLMGCSKALKIVSLIGMPGLGKTSLARSLFDSSSVRNHFDKRAWCVISQNYEKRKMFVDILMDLISNEEKQQLAHIEDEKLGEKIHKSLYSRRYLIIIDDIWTLTTWDDIGRYFPDNGNGSRIMLTSRIKDATPIESIFPTLPFLTEVDSMNLLVKKVFLNKPCPLQLLGIGNKIAKRCKGLPLAVVAIAGILSNLDKEESVWEKVEKDLDTIIIDDLMKVLDYSYEHLPDHLKLCYLYFGTFPEDAKVSVRKIKRLWIAEGFIRKDKMKTQEDVAKDYLHDLINRSLVLIVKREFDDSIKSCGIHDSLRDMCLKKADKMNFMKSTGGEYFSPYMRYHRLHVDCEKSNHFGLHYRSFSGHLSALSCFSQMPLHRVIDTRPAGNSYDAEELKEIDKLVYLRYLCVRGGCVSLQSVSNLVNLEFLDVQKFTGNRELASSIILKMTKLKHLKIRCGARIINDSDRWPGTNLESLSGIRFSELGDEKILKCCPHLGYLKCFSLLSHFPDIGSLTKLENLNIDFIYEVPKIDLTTVNFPSAIKKLTLKATVRSAGFPWETMSVIGRLPNLQILNLYQNVFVGEKWETKDGEFQKLRFLSLVHISTLKQWNTCSEHFPVLRCLVLSDCCDLQDIPSDLGDIPTLHTIDVTKCSYKLYKSVVHIEAEQHVMGNEELEVKISDWYLSKEKLLSEYKQLEAVFSHYKNENDCIITSKELRAAIRSLTGGYCPIEAELESMLNEVDGTIDFSEFLDLMAKIRVPYSEQELQNEKMVREVDPDSDGALNYREFKKLMMTINIPRPNDLRNALLMAFTIEDTMGADGPTRQRRRISEQSDSHSPGSSTRSFSGSQSCSASDNTNSESVDIVGGSQRGEDGSQQIEVSVSAATNSVAGTGSNNGVDTGSEVTPGALSTLFPGYDPPSGGSLPDGYWGPPKTPIVEADEKSVKHVVDTEGHNATKFPNQKLKADRVHIHLMSDGSFNRIDKVDVAGEAELDKYGDIITVCPAMQAIGRAIRDVFEGSYPTWGKVPEDHRKKLWYLFGMKCKWDDDNRLVADAWERYSELNYKELIYRAKKMFEKGGTKYKWMQPSQLAKLVVYWKSLRSRKKSSVAQKNRGVPLDKDGMVIVGGKAPSTSTNGPKPMSKSIKGYMDDKTRKRKRVPICKKKKGASVELITENDVNEDDEEAEAVWIGVQYKEIHEKYLELLKIKYNERENLMPDYEKDKKDPIVWWEAVRVVKRKFTVEKKYWDLVDENYPLDEDVNKPGEGDPKDALLLEAAEKSIPLDFSTKLVGVPRTIIPRLDKFPVGRASQFVYAVDQPVSQTLEKMNDVIQQTQEKLVQSEERGLLFQQQLIEQQEENDDMDAILHAFLGVAPGVYEELPPNVREMISPSMVPTQQRFPGQQTFSQQMYAPPISQQMYAPSISQQMYAPSTPQFGQMSGQPRPSAFTSLLQFPNLQDGGPYFQTQ